MSNGEHSPVVHAAGPGAPGRPPPLRLGPLVLAPPVLLAPMSGLSNLPLRILCEEAGCGLTLTEFLAAPALLARVPRELAKLQPSPQGRPFGVQLFGRDPQQMARAACMAAERGAALLDINMGCPARRVTRGWAGAALMREPNLAAALVQAVREALPASVPVTVKMRAGWDAGRINAPELAACLARAGAAAITVHGRTASQGLSGQADLQLIARVRQALGPGVPLVGNGDVMDTESLERMFEQTGCDAVMIGRAALGNPWIFARCREWWLGLAPGAPPGLAERLQTYLRHLDLHLQIADSARAVLEMRKFAGWYLRGFAGAAGLRRAIYHETDLDAVRKLVRQAAAAAT